MPVENRLAAEGQGGEIFKASMHWERACLFAAYVGMMDRFLERAVGYATDRRQFGKKIGSFQTSAMAPPAMDGTNAALRVWPGCRPFLLLRLMIRKCSLIRALPIDL